MTDTTPAAIEAMLKNVTPGPWRVGPVDDCRVEDADGNEVAMIDGDYNHPDTWPWMEANARFIAAARDLVPSLAAELTTARAERDEARAETYAVRREAEKCFGAQEEVDEAWAAIGTRGNRNHLSLSEQLSSLFREEDARAEKSETELAALRKEVERLRGDAQ